MSIKTIDITPTWTGVLPLIATGIEQGGTAHSAAMQELYRMAKLADRWNAHAETLLAVLQDAVDYTVASEEALGDVPQWLQDAEGIIDKIRAEVS